MNFPALAQAVVEGASASAKLASIVFDQRDQLLAMPAAELLRADDAGLRDAIRMALLHLNRCTTAYGATLDLLTARLDGRRPTTAVPEPDRDIDDLLAALFGVAAAAEKQLDRIGVSFNVIDASTVFDLSRGDGIPALAAPIGAATSLRRLADGFDQLAAAIETKIGK